MGSASVVVCTGFSTGGGGTSTSTFGTTMSGGATRGIGCGGSGGGGGGAGGSGVMKTVRSSGSLGSEMTFAFIMLTTPTAIRACSPATSANLPALPPLPWCR